MTAKIIPFRRAELERTAFGRRRLTPEQRAHRSAMSKRPRRSKNGTPEERAAKAAAAQTAPPEQSEAELRALYERLSPDQRTAALALLAEIAS